MRNIMGKVKILSADEPEQLAALDQILLNGTLDSQVKLRAVSAMLAAVDYTDTVPELRDEDYAQLISDASARNADGGYTAASTKSLTKRLSRGTFKKDKDEAAEKLVDTIGDGRVPQNVRRRAAEALIRSTLHVFDDIGSEKNVTEMSNEELLSALDKAKVRAAKLAAEMLDPRRTKAGLLDAAKEAVADRGLNYGRPEDNFGRIAALWRTHLHNRYGAVSAGTIDVHDVAQMMMLMKIARLENDPDHLDSIIDIAGYAACAAELTQKS